MRFPVELRLRSSRGVMASVLVAHLAAALALFHVPAIVGVLPEGDAPVLVRGGALLVWLALSASLVRALRAERSKRGCVLWLEEDGLVEVLPRAVEESTVCRVDPRSVVVLGGVVWFRPVALEGLERAPRNRSGRLSCVMLLERNLPAQEWRMLRIWLRHKAGRPVAEPAPSA